MWSGALQSCRSKVVFGWRQTSHENRLVILVERGLCVIHKTKCLPLPCFLSDIFSHLLFPPSLPLSFYNPRLIARTVRYRASLETPLLFRLSLQWDIRSKEPICIHANKAEWVHPSWWACEHTLVRTYSPWNQPPRSESLETGGILYSLFFSISGLSVALLAAVDFGWSFLELRVLSASDGAIITGP